MDANRAFGEFLRSRRARMGSEAARLDGRGRRRTPGMKREEIAQLAGISTEWYVKLEQGRAVAPSRETLDALGRALGLDAVEVAHLRALAGASDRPAFQREDVPESLRHLIARLREPAYLTGQRWDILAWNDAAAELLYDFGLLAPERRNILHWMLTNPAARMLFGESWPDEARRMVALFRPTYDLWNGDPAFTELVREVRENCWEFTDWWAQHGVAAPVSGSKLLLHPTRGPLRYDYASFQANDNPALKLALYTEGCNSP